MAVKRSAWRRRRPFGAETKAAGTSATPVAPPVEPSAGRAITVSRRSLFGLALALVVNAGRRGKSSTGGSARGTGGTSTTARAGGSGSVVRIGGAHVRASQQVSTSDAQRLARRSNGNWRGGWHDSTGAGGSSDVVVSLGTNSRTVRASVAFGGDLLGSAVPAETYEIDLLSFVLGADSYDINSPQLGKLNIVPGGANSASATAQSVPGHAEISTIDINGTRIARRVRCELHDQVRRRALRPWHHGLCRSERRPRPPHCPLRERHRTRSTSNPAPMPPPCELALSSPPSSVAPSRHQAPTVAVCTTPTALTPSDAFAAAGH